MVHVGCQCNWLYAISLTVPCYEISIRVTFHGNIPFVSKVSNEVANHPLVVGSRWQRKYIFDDFLGSVVQLTSLPVCTSDGFTV